MRVPHRAWRSIALLCVALLALSCGAPDAPPTERSSAATADRWVPTPHEGLPRKSARLARAINENETWLLQDLERWRRNGAKLGGSRVPDIKLRALYQQRATRKLADHRRLYRRVRRRLDQKARWFYAAVVRTRRVLARLSGEPPKEMPDFRYARPEPPNTLRRYYRAARGRFGVATTVLASVNFVETKFGRVLGPSSAGAKGPMQFLPSTWDAYGNGGNIWDPHDSIMAAGRYLRASGAPERTRDALYAYNPSDAYVEAVTTYAKQMRRKPLRLYDLYWWQVFVTTRKGTFQMTGPGSPRPNL